MDDRRKAYLAAILISGLSFAAGVQFAPNRSISEKERLEKEIELRQAELLDLSDRIAADDASAQRARGELEAVRAELNRASAELVQRFQSGMEVIGLSENDICGDFASDYFADNCERADEYYDDEQCFGRGCP